MKVEITKEMVNKLKQSNEEVLGTKEFGKYECESKMITRSGKSWQFNGWGVPIYYDSYTAKRYNGNWYAYSPLFNERYRLCEAVCNVWGLK